MVSGHCGTEDACYPGVSTGDRTPGGNGLGRRARAGHEHLQAALHAGGVGLLRPRCSCWSSAQASSSSSAGCSLTPPSASAAAPRRRAEPPQIYGSNQLELAWTVIPILIVLRAGAGHGAHDRRRAGRNPPPDALKVTVVGHQWWWEIHYPELGVVTANEMHVPVSPAASAGRPFCAWSRRMWCTASGCRNWPARPT